MSRLMGSEFFFSLVELNLRGSTEKDTQIPQCHCEAAINSAANTHTIFLTMFNCLATCHRESCLERAIKCKIFSGDVPLWAKKKDDVFKKAGYPVLLCLQIEVKTAIKNQA